MRIGLIVHFFDFRNDVRQWIDALSAEHEVVLFVRPEDLNTIQSAGNLSQEIRTIKEKKPGLWNKFWELAFRFLGRLPQSRQNYYLMEQFKISIINSDDKAKKASRLLNLAMALPRLLSYDDFINQLTYRSETDLSGIDQFVCFTELSDNFLVARLIKEGQPPVVYVYSWDHPCKHVRFSQRLHYLVWHQGLKEDVSQLQQINPGNIHVLGATQMGYIYRWQQQKDEMERPFPFPYIYFGCAIGVPGLVESELEIVETVSSVLQKIIPEWKLVVRPYPVLRDWSRYEALAKLPNVVLDDGFRAKKAESIAVQDEFILQKFNTIHHAEAFFHLGTTLGVEACYTKAPSVLIDLAEFRNPSRILDLHHFIHQYQNDKYLNLKQYPNVVKNLAALEALLHLVRKNKHSLLNYNQKVAEQLKILSFTQLAEKFSTLLTKKD